MSTWTEMQSWVAWRTCFFETHRQMSHPDQSNADDLRARWQALELFPSRAWSPEWASPTSTKSWHQSGSDFLKMVLALPAYTEWKLPPRPVIDRIALATWESSDHRYERRLLNTALDIPNAQLLMIESSLKLEKLSEAFSALNFSGPSLPILLWTETRECAQNIWHGTWLFLSQAQCTSPVTTWCLEERVEWISLN